MAAPRSRPPEAVPAAAASSRPSILAARSLCASPRGVRPEAPPVVGPLELELAPGEHAAIMGPNGAGKSTLLQALAGLAPLRGGELLVDGVPLVAAGMSRRGAAPIAAGGAARAAVRLVLQNPDNQFITVSVEREIALGLEFLGVSRAAIRPRVDAALAAFELEPLRGRPPHRLSGGEKQRVAIAAMMALGPRVLLLDEPCAYLDARGRAHLAGALASLPAEVAVLRVVSHAGEALAGTRAMVLERGALIADGPATEVLSRVPLLKQHRLEVPAMARLAHELELRDAAPALDPLSRLDPARMTDAVASHLAAAGVRPGVPASVPPAERGAESAADPRGALSGEDLRFSYRSSAPGGARAVSGVTLSVRRGEVTALLGGSGAGKSTLLALLSGTEAPDQGSVLVDGRTLDGGSAGAGSRRRVGVLFQFAEDQMVSGTVLEDVAFGPLRSGRREAESKRVAAETLLGLGFDEGRLHESLDRLSYGERRLAALAGVLALEPDYLLLDEPTAGLDHAARTAVARLLERLADDGCGILLATHDVELAAAIAGRAVVLAGGSVVKDGPFPAILEDAALLEYAALEPPPLARVVAGLRRRGFPVRWPRRLTAGATADAIAISRARTP